MIEGLEQIIDDVASRNSKLVLIVGASEAAKSLALANIASRRTVPVRNVGRELGKPIDGRRGWSLEQLTNYNRERFEDLVSASWDLVIIDESHRMGGSTDQVARYKLGVALAEAAPYARGEDVSHRSLPLPLYPHLRRDGA